MSSYKLTYFNIRGRAEPIRLLFAASGVPYEDCRLSYEEFQKLKADGKFPFGQVPVLEVDGKVLAQSMTIFKYVARQTGLAPTDSFDVAKADMIVDALVDLTEKAVKIHLEKDEENKKTLSEALFQKDLPAALANFEKLIESNDGKHFAGTKMSYADIMCFSLVDGFFIQREEEIPTALETFPQLKGLFGEVKSNPGIREWLSQRPKTQI